MNISKKLAIPQLILSSVMIVVWIGLVITIVMAATASHDKYDTDIWGNSYRDGERSTYDILFDTYIFAIIGFGILYFICALGILGIGITQIVFAAKEKSGAIYLTSGIIAIVNVLFVIVQLFLSIALIIINAIGIAKKA